LSLSLANSDCRQSLLPKSQSVACAPWIWILHSCSVCKTQCNECNFIKLPLFWQPLADISFIKALSGVA